MSNLLQLLQEVDPEISASMAADLRAALVAVNQQAQADPASADWSLNSWWQWLEDEGYNRDILLAYLQRFCASRLGDAALANLVAACHAHGDDPHGLEWVQTLISDLDAELIELFHRLEAESLLEDLQLAQTAGGMSRGAAWGTAGGVVLGCGVITLTAWLILRKKDDNNSAERFVSQSIDQTDAMIHEQATVYDNMALNSALNDPEKLLDAKAAAEYTYTDTLNKSRALAMEHVAKFGIKDYEAVIKSDVEQFYLNSPGGRGLEKVMKESNLATDGFDPADLNQVKAFLSSSDGEAFVRQTAEFWKKMGWDRFTRGYFELVQREVDAGKRAKEAAAKQGDDFIEAARKAVKVDLSSNVGGLVGEFNQAAEAELQIEVADARSAVRQEVRVGEQIERDAEDAADA